MCVFPAIVEQVTLCLLVSALGVYTSVFLTFAFFFFAFGEDFTVPK